MCGTGFNALMATGAQFGPTPPGIFRADGLQFFVPPSAYPTFDAFRQHLASPEVGPRTSTVVLHA
jgi:hypothetical protein